MMPFVRRCCAAVLDGVSEVVDGGTTTVRAGERPKTRVSLRVIPQRRRQVMPWCGCQHAFVANWHPRVVSPGGRARTRAARRSKASGVFLSVRYGLGIGEMSPRGRPVRHTMRSKRHRATLTPVHQLRGYAAASVQ